MTRTVINSTVCILLLWDCAVAANRSPDPVAKEILKDPQVEHVPTLMSALNGAGCRPRRSDVGDALVKIGEPAVEPLLKQLKTAKTWPHELESVHLLALMGTKAESAVDDLEKWLEAKRHPLPARYAVVALAAARDDVDAMIACMSEGHSGTTPFVAELLSERAATLTEAQLKQLQELDQDHRIIRRGVEAVMQARAKSKAKPQAGAAEKRKVTEKTEVTPTTD